MMFTILPGYGRGRILRLRRSGRPLQIGFLGPEGTFTEEALLSAGRLRGGRARPPRVAGRGARLGPGRAVRPGLRPHRERHRGHGPRHHRQPGLRLRPPHPAGGGPGHPPPPDGDPGDRTWATSSGWRPSPWPPAQCRAFLSREAPRRWRSLATNSTAEAARLVGQHDPAMSARPTAAIAPRLAAKLYGLDILVEDVEDHPDNQTRFVSLARTGIPAPTGHDKTSIVCFQRADHPGSLHGILGQFAARNINLSKLESRPTKQALGDYCFIIDFEGHIADDVVARLPTRPPRRAGRGEVPRLVSGGRTGRSRPPARGRDVMDRGRYVGRRPAGRGRLGRAALRRRRPLPGRAPTTLTGGRRDGRADECAALEKP